jgi:hypothetical protein
VGAGKQQILRFAQDDEYLVDDKYLVDDEGRSYTI